MKSLVRGGLVDDRTLRQWIQQHVRVAPKELKRYKIALTVKKNEVMEFFGDSVIGFVVSEYLVTQYPFIDAPGWFTRARAVLVENSRLAVAADRLGLGAVLMGVESEQTSPKTLADALEALIGAVYLDQGLRKCKEVTCQLLELEKEALAIARGDRPTAANPQKARKQIEQNIKGETASALESKNPISALQEFLAKKGEDPPEYLEIGREGPPHEPVFVVEARCQFRGRALATEGMGGKIKKAKETAAELLLEEVMQVYREEGDEF